MNSRKENRIRASSGRLNVEATARRDESLRSMDNQTILVMTLRNLMHAARDPVIKFKSFHDALTTAEQLFAKDLEAEFSESPQWPFSPFPAARKGGES